MINHIQLKNLSFYRRANYGLGCGQGLEAAKFCQTSRAIQNIVCKPYPEKLLDLNVTLFKTSAPSSGRSAGQTVKSPIVIALTANASGTDRPTMLAVGCSDFVSKPIQRSQILQKMADYLGACYIYDDASTKNLFSQGRSTLSGLAAAAISQSALSPEPLHTLPLNGDRRLHQQACLAEQNKIHALLNDILKANSSLAGAIQALVDPFDYKKIITCTEQVLDYE